MAGFGLSTAAQAAAKTGSKHTASTTKSVVHTAAHTVAATKAEVMPYSGGRQMTADPSGGYWTVSWVGAVTAYGGAPTFGSPVLSGIKLAKPIVGMAATPDGQGYWLVGSDGGVFSYGDAKFYGSTGAIHLNQPIVNIESTADGKGYWLVASDGGVFTYGDAKFYGSTGAIHLNKPIVGMAATTNGLGYWLVASDGGIFTYGDAKFYGSTGAIHLNKPIAGMAPTPTGAGYWLVASDGGIFTFGNATFSGSLGGTGKTVTGIMVAPSTSTYTLVEMNGTDVVPTLTPVAPASSTTSPPSGTTPTASSNAGIPDAPASLSAPTNLVLADDFNTGSLNTALWSPTWFGNTAQQNQTTMSASNVAVGASGLELTDAANNTGGIVSSNPDDSQPGHTGFQIAPSAGKPVYVEYQATLPAAANGQVANWPALWLVGQSPWPQNGEIDVMEGLGGSEAYHIHFGTGNGSGADGPGAPAMSSPGTHTFGVMWTTTSVTFVYDGKVVGTENESLDSPMFIIMENSIGDFGGPTTLPATETVRYVKVWQ